MSMDIPEPPYNEDEYASAYSGGGSGNGRRGGSRDAERTPPHDLLSEQSTLGGMLLSKDAVADVVETLRGSDFYIPKHEVIFEAILSLYSHGEPTDVIAVTDELMKSGDLQRAGGVDYLHSLTSIVPTAANAGYYAGIVQERALLRRLVDAGTRIVQMGYDGEGEAVELVNQAQAEIYGVTGQEQSEDYVPLEVAIGAAVEEIEMAKGRDGQMTGVPTGFKDLDELTNGLHPGQMIVVAARPAMGKALALDTPLPTPSGWTTMGDVQVGDELYGADGRPTRVVAVTEVMTDRDCFEIEFSDGSTIVADAQHQWRTCTRAARRSATGSAETVTTQQIFETLRVGSDGRANHSVVNAAPIAGDEAELPVPPYTLGVQIVRAGEHIPEQYLRASVAQRRALLAGLMDTDGTVVRGVGSCQLSVTNKKLADSAYELIVSLGYRCGRTTKQVAGASEASSTAYILNFSTVDDVFRLERKRELHSAERPVSTLRIGQRYITDVRPVASVPVKCVQVDNEDHLYLAGESMIPTHNSTLAREFARAAALKNNKPAVFFSLEMGRSEIAMRLLSAEGEIFLQKLRKGDLDSRDWTKLAATRGRINEAPLYIDDSPNMTLVEIRAKCRRLKQRVGLSMVIIDYLQLLTSGKRVESRQQEVSEFSRALKLMAKELQVPVIALSQLNRGPEQRTDKRPMVSDLRESGSIEQDADMVILLHRDEVYDKSARQGEADLIVAKHRNGPTADIAVAFQGHLSRFHDMVHVSDDFGEE